MSTLKGAKVFKCFEAVYEWSVIAIAISIALMAFGGLFLAGDGQLYRPVLTYLEPQGNLPVQPGGVTHLTEKKIYQVGETVYAWVNVIKYRNVPGIVEWQLMGNRYYPYSPRSGVLSVGRHHRLVQVERIDKHVPSGDFYFEGQVRCPVNFLSIAYYPIKTNPFRVVNEDDTP